MANKTFNYRQAYLLLEKWPKDAKKSTKDLGDLLRIEVKSKFPQGEKSPENSKSLNFEIFEKFCNNHYLNKYPRKYLHSTSTGLQIDALKQVVQNKEGFEELKLTNKSLMDKIRTVFSS